MGVIYANAIINGERTYESVPEFWREKTKKALKEKVEKNVITQETYEEITGERYTE